MFGSKVESRFYVLSHDLSYHENVKLLGWVCKRTTVLQTNKNRTDKTLNINLSIFQAYKKNDVNLSLEARKVKDLDAATRDWIVDLMERNLKEVIDMVSANSEQIR